MFIKISFVFTLTFIGYLLGFINQLIIAYFFGTSSDLDVYFYSVSVVNFLVFYGGAFPEIVTPIFHQKFKNSTVVGSIYLSAAINASVLFSFLVTFIFIILYNFDFLNMVENSISSEFIAILLPLVFIIPLNLLFQHSLNTVGFHVVPAVSKILLSFVFIIMLLLFVEDLGIKSLFYGYIVGNLAQFLLLSYYLRKVNFTYKHSFKLLPKDNLRQLILFSGTYLISAVQVFYERTVLFELSESILSSYNYAFSIINLPQMLIVSVVVAFFWEHLLKKITSDEARDGLVDLIEYAIKFSFYGVFLACIISIFSEEIIYTLFARGDFTYQSIRISSSILSVGCWLIPLLIFNSLVGRAYISIGRIRFASKINIASATFSIFLLFLANQLGQLELVILVPVVVQFLVAIISYKCFWSLLTNFRCRIVVPITKLIKIIVISSFSIAFFYFLKSSGYLSINDSKGLLFLALAGIGLYFITVVIYFDVLIRHEKIYNNW